MHQLVADFERLIDAQLTHPAIAAPLATGIVENHAYLAAEFVPAESLDIIIRDHGPAPLHHAIGLAAQLAGAVDFAAVVHIGHGVLHPRDVLVSQEETRITGFGIAQALEKVGVPIPVRRPYTAPERLDRGEWGREADIFSVAAICYELLMGRRIAGAGGEAAGGLSGVPGIDLEMARAVFARALAIEPARRFNSALEFVDALRQSLVESPAEPSTSRPDAPDPRPIRRSLEEDLLLPLDTAAMAEPAVDVPLSRIAEPEIRRDVPHPTAGPAPAASFTPSDLELRAAEAERYQDVETSPAVVAAPEPHPGRLTADTLSVDAAPRAVGDVSRTARVADDVPATHPVADDVAAKHPTTQVASRELPIARAPEAVSSPVVEQPRSRPGRVATALLVGIVLGFAGGYGLGARNGGHRPVSDTGSAGREFTESAVPPATVGTAAAPPPAPGAPATGSQPSGSANAPVGTAPAQASTGSAADTPAAPPGVAAAGPAPRTPGRDASSATEASAGSGRILVRSTPADALVYIDGRERGRTPVAVRDLTHGAHSVRVVRDGYTPEERRVVLTARRPSQSLHIALPRIGGDRDAVPVSSGETFVGALSVESRPTGANVYVDGQLVGTTPLTMPRVNAGSHAVRLEHDGYRRWSSSVRVVAGERNRVTASLEK